MMDIAYRRFEKKNDYTAFGSVGDMICPFDINGELTRLSCSNASGMTEFDNRIVVHSANPSGKIHELVFSYHPGQLDCASWITDSRGVAVQHIQYLPYGEPYINQRLSGYNERFTFTGKERDAETGYGYFGARYIDHELMTMWLGVDPMADKYPNISPYAYCAWNPLKLVDRTGMCADGWQLELTTGLWTKTDLRGGGEFLSGLTGAASFAAASGSRELSLSLMSNGLSTTNLIFGGLIDERW